MDPNHSDIDFYERKIYRLESDIATLHEELNISKTRLRTAEDYQIKYELLLRQSNNENNRLKRLEEEEREKFSVLLRKELENAEMSWTNRMSEFEQSLIEQEEIEKEGLRKQISELKKKVNAMSAKNEQVDILMFKNKKIAKELESLEEMIEESKQMNERSKQEEIKATKETLTKKYEERILKERQSYEENIKYLQEEVERLSSQLVTEAIKTERLRVVEQFDPRSPSMDLVPAELIRLRSALNEKDDQIENALQERISSEEKFQAIRQELNKYISELQNKIFEMEKSHDVDLFNLKSRMEQARAQQLEELQKKNEFDRKEQFREKEVTIRELNDEVSDLKDLLDRKQAENRSLLNDKDRLIEKLTDVKNRLREFEHDKEMGETEMFIASLKNTQNKEDNVNQYENGINFLEKQLRKASIKIDKKNNEVKELISEMTRIRNECDQEVSELKDKYYQDLDASELKISNLEDEIRELNEEVRQREKAKRDLEAELGNKISQLKAEIRGLQNLNSDLQRDYNRILESKKTAEKSYREEREKGMNSKAEISIAKKQNWLELERQKNEIEIIYQEKTEQLKANFNIEIEDLRVSRDQYKKQAQLLKAELAARPVAEKDKENLYADYHKKLATINLQIALTENLYNTFVEAKSRMKSENPRKQSDIKAISEVEEGNKSGEFINSQRYFDELLPESSRSLEELRKELEKRDAGGSATPAFNMAQSFNPKYN